MNIVRQVRIAIHHNELIHARDIDVMCERGLFPKPVELRIVAMDERPASLRIGSRPTYAELAVMEIAIVGGDRTRTAGRISRVLKLKNRDAVGISRTIGIG